MGHAKAFGLLFADTLLAGFNYRRSFSWDGNGELAGDWYHGSGGSSPTFHCEGLSSIPDQSIRGFWWTKWHWKRFLSEFFGFTVSIFPHQFHFNL